VPAAGHPPHGPTPTERPHDPPEGKAADMHPIRVTYAFDGQPSPPDTATEVVHHNRIVGVERGPGLTRLRA